MVALAIALPVLTVLYREGALAVTGTRTASAYEEAISRAQSRLDALAGSAPAAGEREGDDGGGYRWRTNVAVLGTAAPLQPGAGGTSLYAVRVEVSWPGTAGGWRRVVLETFQLAPVKASQVAAGP